jgi:hypothetical protein
MLASLALCGAATAALVISTAHAQPSAREPMMVAQADNAAADNRGRRANRPAPADLAQRLSRLCQDTVARQTGELAYLETSLNLTASQQPLFQRWKEAKLVIARRHADQCGQRVNERVTQRQNAQGANQTGQNPAANRPGPAQRMTQEEDRLKQRVADIDTERPSLEAFYNVLSPDQKTQFDRAGMRGRGMMGGRRLAFAGGPRGPQGGPMGGPMGRAPMDRLGPPPLEGPGAPPPPAR